MIIVTLSNSAGPLDSRTLPDCEKVRDAIRDLIDSVPDFYPGDTITVTEQ